MLLAGVMLVLGKYFTGICRIPGVPIQDSGPGSQVEGPRSGSYVKGPGSQVPRVGPGSHFSGMLLVFIKKEALTQVFSCEFCEISKNTFFTEHLRWLLLLFWHKTEWSTLKIKNSYNYLFIKSIARNFMLNMLHGKQKQKC